MTDVWFPAEYSTTNIDAAIVAYQRVPVWSWGEWDERHGFVKRRHFRWSRVGPDSNDETRLEGVLKSPMEAEAKRLDLLTELAVGRIAEVAELVASHPKLSAGEEPECNLNKMSFIFGVGLGFEQIEMPLAQIHGASNATVFGLAVKEVFERVFPAGVPPRPTGPKRHSRPTGQPDELDELASQLDLQAVAGADPMQLATMAAELHVNDNKLTAPIALALGMANGSLNPDWTDDQLSGLTRPAVCGYHLARLVLGTSNKTYVTSGDRAEDTNTATELFLMVAESSARPDFEETMPDLDIALTLIGTLAAEAFPGSTGEQFNEAIDVGNAAARSGFLVGLAEHLRHE